MSRILVVDDSDTILSFVQDLLERAGHEVETSGDWVQANQIVHRSRPDLVVLDQNLGAFQGSFLVRAFRSFFGDRLPVVVISGEDVAEAAIAAGANAFVPKHQLREVLPTLIARLTAPGHASGRWRIGANGGLEPLEPPSNGAPSRSGGAAP